MTHDFDELHLVLELLELVLLVAALLPELLSLALQLLALLTRFLLQLLLHVLTRLLLRHGTAVSDSNASSKIMKTL